MIEALSLDQWLTLLENRHADEVQLGLQRVRAVASRLSLCDLGSCVVITVAGTNGKGSTVASLEAIYVAAGFRVGSYTSPHLFQFNERIRVNKQCISDESLTHAFGLLEMTRGDIHLTYFEMTTLAALYHFKQSNLDVVILEVGMGGRLDATNIIDADLAIITTIDLDHQAYLGNTVEAIGYEKAGILRPHQLFIYADENPPMSVLEQAALLNTRTYVLGREYFFTKTPDNICILRENKPLLTLPRPDINPKAVAAAIMASELIVDKLALNSSQYALAMQTISLFGRQQIMSGPVARLFDVAHNPQAVSLLAKRISGHLLTGKVHAVFSALKDKDLCGLIRPMLSLVDHWYLGVLSGKRAASPLALFEGFPEDDKTKVSCFDNPVLAYEAAMTQAKLGDIIVVYGSFLTVSAIMLAEQMDREDFK